VGTGDSSSTFARGPWKSSGKESDFSPLTVG
jgi:hypothetical protein